VIADSNVNDAALAILCHKGPILEFLPRILPLAHAIKPPQIKLAYQSIFHRAALQYPNEFGTRVLDAEKAAGIAAERIATLVRQCSHHHGTRIILVRRHELRNRIVLSWNDQSYHNRDQQAPRHKTQQHLPVVPQQLRVL